MQTPVPPHAAARRFTACDVCYKKKIKCDGALPQCNWCLHQGLECTYARPNRRRVTKQAQTSRTALKPVGLLERIRRLDERRADAMAGERSGSLARASCQSAALTPCPRIIHFAGWEILNINVAQAGVPDLLPEGLHWIKSRTGVVISLPTTSHAPWEKPLSSMNESGLSAIGTILELPKKPVLKQYLDVYLSSHMYKIFPVIESSLFSSTIRTAYQPRGLGPRIPNPSARACVFAFMAFVSCLGQLNTCNNTPRPSPTPCREYITQAQILLPAIIQEPLNMDALQTALILAVISSLSGEVQTAVYRLSVAARFIIASGAHTMTDGVAPTNTPDFTVKRHLRTLFWFCYALDKDLALRTGQAHVLKDDDCALDLPPAYNEHLHSCLDHSPGTDPDIIGPIFPVELRLSMIKSRAFTVLYSHNGLRKSDTDLIRSIRELDEELEHWRSSLPSHLRPQLSFAPKHDKPKNTFLIITHMNYYSCVNLIHLASSRCSAWRSPSTEGGALIHRLQSSLVLAVEASRSLLLFLEDSEFRVDTGSFWTLIFHTMSAVITIFCNLLENPAAESAESDMQLLVLAEQTTARLFLRRDTPMDRVIDLQPISDFISRLREHANRAILGESHMDGRWQMPPAE
ncbi:hypothetical protein BDW74DRAFT_161432 [Aspergillus multicolor]|uniref:uncharacterized protein n=1 Tax=Aspergillus multicolor TaxID=41759 RepID=UPI003CCDFF37